MATQPDGQSDSDDGQTDKEHRRDTDIRQLVQAENAAFVVLTYTEINWMIVTEIINYHASHLFPLLCRQVDAAIEDTFTTGLHQNNEEVRQELNTAVARAVEDTIRDGQADLPFIERHV